MDQPTYLKKRTIDPPPTKTELNELNVRLFSPFVNLSFLDPNFVVDQY